MNHSLYRYKFHFELAKSGIYKSCLLNNHLKGLSLKAIAFKSIPKKYRGSPFSICSSL